MRNTGSLFALLVGAAACTSTDTTLPAMGSTTEARTGTAVAVIDTVLPDYFEAAGTTAPLERSTLSTRLMSTVSEVYPVEGTRVSRGQLLVKLDTRDLEARRTQAAAAVAEATAAVELAEVTALRMRALHSDSAAPRAQLDAAETGLRRAKAGLEAARGAMAELEATTAYSEVRSPFNGVVTKRFVDPGALAAPGAPLVTVETTSRLRISAAFPSSLSRGLVAGKQITALIEGHTVDAVIEGVVPATAGLQTINALVGNDKGEFPPGGAATILIPNGERKAVLVPVSSLVHQGDLVGVHRVHDGASALTWISTGRTIGNLAEVLSGLTPGDSVKLPAAGRR